MKVFLKKVRALYIVMLGGLLSIAIISCSDDIYNDSEFVAGETFTDSNIRLILIDTLTVSTSTMKFDSIVTSESTRILLGKYTDTVFGSVTASSYMQLHYRKTPYTLKKSMKISIQKVMIFSIIQVV